MRKSYVKTVCVLELFMFVLMTSCSSNVERTSKQADLSGKWSGSMSDWMDDWGLVTIQDNHGTYSSTYGPQPGEFTFERVGDNTYRGTWREKNMEHGTISFVVSEDGKKITGTWTSDEDSTIRPKKEGPILWTRE